MNSQGRSGLSKPGRSELAAPENVDSLLVPDPDIGSVVSIKVPYCNLGSYSGIRIQKMRDKFHPVFFTSPQFKPVKNRGLICSGVSTAMSPPTLARNEIC